MLLKSFSQIILCIKTDVTIDLQNNNVLEHNTEAEPWKITLVDTGKDSMTGGRVKRIQNHIGNEHLC